MFVYLIKYRNQHFSNFNLLSANAVQFGKAKILFYSKELHWYKLKVLANDKFSVTQAGK